jgi:hypothetical protein
LTFDKATVRLGQELVMHVDHVPNDWRGEVLVNGLHSVHFDSKLFRLKASSANGFVANQDSDVYILLTNSKGQLIPLPNAGHFRVAILPSPVSIDRDGRDVDASEVSGTFSLTAQPTVHWSISGAPDWIKVDPVSAAGNTAVTYTVAANRTNEPRSAVLTIGDATFQVAQSRNPFIQIPYQDSFRYVPPDAEKWALGLAGVIVPPTYPSRWFWQENSGFPSPRSIKPEGPSGASAMVIEKSRTDTQSWASLAVLPHIDVQTGAKYKVSVWMKAQNPGKVSVVFLQASAPYHVCGLAREFSVTSQWTEYSVPFRVQGEDCEAKNNRLDLQFGTVKGKIWVSNFSLAELRQ